MVCTLTSYKFQLILSVLAMNIYYFLHQETLNEDLRVTSNTWMCFTSFSGSKFQACFTSRHIVHATGCGRKCGPL